MAKTNKDMMEELQEKDRRCREIEPPVQVTNFSTFEEIGRAIGAVVATKNKLYGDSFAHTGDVLRMMYPDGIKPHQYDDALAVVRVLDKLFRVATDRDALGENPWEDIGGYSILSVKRTRK